MYRIVISKDGKQTILRPVLEAEDAIYWVNRLSKFDCQADVVRDDAVNSRRRVEATAQPA